MSDATGVGAGAGAGAGAGGVLATNGSSNTDPVGVVEGKRMTRFRDAFGMAVQRMAADVTDEAIEKVFAVEEEEGEGAGGGKRSQKQRRGKKSRGLLVPNAVELTRNAIAGVVECLEEEFNVICKEKQLAVKLNALDRALPSSTGTAPLHAARQLAMSTKLAQEEELLAALKTVEAENEELEGKLRQYHARAVAVQSALQDKLATTTAVSAAADAAASTS